MAIDRQQKKKKKREQRRKDRRIRTERVQRHEKAEFFSYNANEAYHNGDYISAHILSLKSLKLDPSDDYIREIAMKCAAFLKEEMSLYPILLQCYRRGSLVVKEEYLLLGDLAFARKEYGLAREIFKGLLSETFIVERPLTKTQIKKVERALNDSDIMEQAEEIIKKQHLPSTFHQPKEKTKQSAEVSSIQTSTIKKEKEQDTAEDIRLEPKITYELKPEPVLKAIKEIHRSNISSLEITLQAYKLSFRTSYEQLLCLPTLRNVQSLWYQEETARKVLKNFRGRAILSDEVGLGKTIEACICLKEYIMRGLVKTVLILTPSNLVRQWQEEMLEKFQLSFISSNDTLFRQQPQKFWNSTFVLSSINTAKSKHNFEMVTSRNYDMVIVDEAHHLKNRSTLNWKLINTIHKTYLLLLTATPVQNNLEELYNLVTLLRPGHLKTRKAFKQEFITRGNPTDPQNREKLRGLLQEVMLRNTRSITQLRLPPRFATTVKVSPTQAEEKFYQAVSDFVAEQADSETKGITRLGLQKLLEAAGSSHISALRMLQNIADKNENGVSRQVRKILGIGKKIQVAAKTERVVELLQALPDQKIIFVNYVATLEYLKGVLDKQNIPYVIFQGAMTSAQKQAAIDRFRDGCPVFLATGTGGEGHNLQFCHTMINYDLPWNPMEIEQRIGRIHRIGQENEVQVYNFCAAGSIEDHILEVLDRKINMFELVVGEIDMILGHLKDEQEFGDMVYNIWIKNRDEKKRKNAFSALSSKLKRARNAYSKSKELDEKLFQEDFGV
ncbi:DEAD/DEAH box helicase [candidate division KSB1 bacterium]|nr:DEAD/DEAH box helicase [candidate division KSB1 bacterium]